jgi:hypothetical protein
LDHRRIGGRILALQQMKQCIRTAFRLLTNTAYKKENRL